MENITPAPWPWPLSTSRRPNPPQRQPGASPKRSSPRSTRWCPASARRFPRAAEAAGLARESLSRALSKPHVAELMRTKVLRSLAMARDRASTFVLGLAGIAPETTPSVNVNINLKAGYVIDLSDDPPPMRTIPHE